VAWRRQADHRSYTSPMDLLRTARTVIIIARCSFGELIADGMAWVVSPRG
jgi:hypothetical protein